MCLSVGVCSDNVCVFSVVILLFCFVLVRCGARFSCCFFFFQAEDGIRDAQESRGLGDVYKRQVQGWSGISVVSAVENSWKARQACASVKPWAQAGVCLLYTSDAADDLLCVDLGGRRIIKTKNANHQLQTNTTVPTNDTTSAHNQTL